MLGWGRVCVVGVCRCNRLSASSAWPHVTTRVNLGSVVLQLKVGVWSLCVWWGGGGDSARMHADWSAKVGLAQYVAVSGCVDTESASSQSIHHPKL